MGETPHKMKLGICVQTHPINNLRCNSHAMSSDDLATTQVKPLILLFYFRNDIIDFISVMGKSRVNIES